MGLRKTRTVAGFSAEYWNIGNFHWEKTTNEITINLNNYKDKQTREQSIENRFDGFATTRFIADEEFLNTFLAYLYEKAKESNTNIDNEIEDTGEVDENGNPITRTIPFFEGALDE